MQKFTKPLELLNQKIGLESMLLLAPKGEYLLTSNLH